MGNSIHPKRTTSKVRKNKGPWKKQAMRSRREIADERQALSDKLTPQQRLANLDKLNLTAAKERAKLLAKLSANGGDDTGDSRPQGREVKNRTSKEVRR